MRLTRRAGSAPRPPADVLASLGGVRGDRLLAWARADDAWALGTPLGLVVVPDVGEPRRVPWELVEKAGWDQDTLVLEVSELAAWGEAKPVHRLAMPDPTAPVRLLELVRERVTASIVLQRRVSTSGRQGVTITARRSPGGGEIAWFTDLDPGVDPADPEVAARTEVALTAARGELI